MLTIRQNFLETIRGGKPDRFVKQFEYLTMFPRLDPIGAASPKPDEGTENLNAWGVTIAWHKGQPGAFPVHDDKHKVIHDLSKWRYTVRMPHTLDFPDDDWKPIEEKFAGIDRSQTFACYFEAPGLFENLHYLQSIDDCLANFYEEPKAMHELVDYITEYEINIAKAVCQHIHPDALFHHDDWGSSRSSFLSPAMFHEFIYPAYKKIYGTWHDLGVDIIVHHNDAYSANLVPDMIDCGINVWQGAVSNNNVPALVKEYGKYISFMGDLDNSLLDKKDWSKEEVDKEVKRAVTQNGKHYYIPCLNQGGVGSTFPGVYEEVNAVLDKYSKEMF
jgi:hypothetical protein